MNLERRYLLGVTSDDENATVEVGYLRDADALNGVANEEEALIDAYLAGELDPSERALFEQHYLASPLHRRRVDAIRMLRQVRSPQPGASSMRRWLAVAAVLCLAIGSAWPFVRRSSPARRQEPMALIATQSAPAVVSSPRVFAYSLPLVNVRGPDEAPRLIVPDSIDIVRLDLEGERSGQPDHDIVLQTVAGTEVWRGRAVTAPLPLGAAFRVELPAALLRPDDYFVIVEARRYFLSVRTGP